MKNVYVLVFVALLVIYTILAFGLPADPNVLAKHGLTETGAKMLNATFVVPIILIYLAALYGFVRVKDYARRIRNTKEGPSFNQIANGLMFVAFSLPINAIIGSIANYIRHAYPHLLSDITIVRQYLALAFALAGIYLISKGAQGLFNTLKRPAATKKSVLGFLGPIVLASMYTWLIVSQYRRFPGDEPYYVPEWAVIATFAIPYVFVWCTGIWAAIQLHRYQLGVKGVIYKRALDNLSKGIAGIIFIYVVIQFITTLSGLLNRLDLTPLLMIIYILVALYAVGYGLVARGARKLKQLEEV